MDAEAREVWVAIYPELSGGKAGILGALTARAEAQAVRLATVYALLDRSVEIAKDHLLAALALVTYSERSVEYVWADRLGDPVADSILAALRNASDGLSRTKLGELFSRHQKSADVARALRHLLERGLVETWTQDTDGRPLEMWRARR